jgi:protoporphyrinogen oxidase
VFEIMIGMKDIPKKIVPQGMKFLKNFAKVRPLLERREGDSVYGMDELAKTIASQSVTEWTLENAGDEVLDKLIAPMANGIEAGVSEKISIVQPLYILNRVAGTGQIKGGHHGSINKALYEFVKDDVRLNTKIEKVVIENGKVCGVQLADGEFVEADYVICCTEADNALRLLPDAPESVKDALVREEYSVGYDYILTTPERRDPKEMEMVMISPSTGSKLSIMFEENAQDLCAAPGSSLMHCFTSPTYFEEFEAMSEEEHFLAVRAEAARILPDLTDAEMLGYHTYGIGDTVHGPCYQGNGSFKALYEMEDVYHDEVKGLRLAGAYRVMHCSAEGAYFSGRIEAEAVAAELA